MREIPLPQFLLAFCLLLPANAWAQPVDSMPLKVIGKSFNEPAPDSPFIEPATYTLALRNDSEQDITAWRIVCLYAEGDGNFATTGLARDSFMRYEMGGGRDTAATGGLVPSGAMLDVVVARNENMAHPYGATSCRVDAVIFSDSSYAGEPQAVDALRAKRERLAAEAVDAMGRPLIDNQPGPSQPEGENLVTPPATFGSGEPSGCEMNGHSKGASQSHCGGFHTPIKEINFQLSAACRNPCTGETWNVNASPKTVYGDCPQCDARLEDGGVTQPHLWTRKYSVDAESRSWAPISEICFVSEAITSSVECNCPNCGVPSPILITLSDGRYQLTDAENGVLFDLDADGKAEQTAWTAEGSDEGFLALDRDMNGTIDDYMEIFGDHTPQVPSNEPNGWRALAVWDDSLNGGNEDGVIDANDRIFSSLLIWVDSNHNGFSEPEELSSLEEAGVEYLELDYGKSAKTDQFGNQFRYWSKVGMANGRTVTAWDVFFVHL